MSKKSSRTPSHNSQYPLSDYATDNASTETAQPTVASLMADAAETQVTLIEGLASQVEGDHYRTKIQPVEFIESNNLCFVEGNIIKYVHRHAAKGGLKDLKKALHYLQLLMELRYGAKLATCVVEGQNTSQYSLTPEIRFNPSSKTSPTHGLNPITAKIIPITNSSSPSQETKEEAPVSDPPQLQTKPRKKVSLVPSVRLMLEYLRYDVGMSKMAIASKLGCSYRTVLRWYGEGKGGITNTISKRMEQKLRKLHWQYKYLLKTSAQ